MPPTATTPVATIQGLWRWSRSTRVDCRISGRATQRTSGKHFLVGTLRLASAGAAGYSPPPRRRRAGFAEGRAMLRTVGRYVFGMCCVLVAGASAAAQQPLSAPPPSPAPPPVVDLTPAELPGRQ